MVAFGRNISDHSDLYVTTDGLLLADVSKNFRKVCIENYGLDPAHYCSSPGLSWDGLLKKTGVEPELLTDKDMLIFIRDFKQRERGRRRRRRNL